MERHKYKQQITIGHAVHQLVNAERLEDVCITCSLHDKCKPNRNDGISSICEVFHNPIEAHYELVNNN